MDTQPELPGLLIVILWICAFDERRRKPAKHSGRQSKRHPLALATTPTRTFPKRH